MRTFEVDVEQGSYEWHEEKSGILSASTAELYLVKGKNDDGIGAGLFSLYQEKKAEILTIDRDCDSFTGKSAQWGIDTEPLARREFSVRNLVTVEEVGFIRSADHYIGISPDGIIRSDKEGVEIKCYDSKNHIEVVTSGVVPKKVIAQCQYSLMVTGFNVWNAVFYDPRVVEKLQYAQFRIERDEQMIEMMREKAIKVSDMIKEAVKDYV